MSDYKSISEIVSVETGEARAPLDEWDIEILEKGLTVNVGDIGGREPLVANARVHVTEKDGSSWEGFAQIT